MKKGDNDSRGFTIIEVALVLAIAGLIFLMVFVALPGLRASQRDTSRREDMMSLIDSIKRYQQNNRGTLPRDTGDVVGGQISSDAKSNTWAGFYREYLGDDFIDPDGEPYNLKVSVCAGSGLESDCEVDYSGDTSFPNGYNIAIVIQATCKGETAVKSSNPRKFAVIYKLEGAGTYCSNT